jgi:hypothetical protein
VELQKIPTHYKDLKWAGNVVEMCGTRNAYRILVEKSQKTKNEMEG